MSRSILDGLRAAKAMIDQTPPFGPDQYIVHPTEYAWIKNPVGPPPTVNAVSVALSTGAIDDTHPAAAALKARLTGEAAAKEPGSDG